LVLKSKSGSQPGEKSYPGYRNHQGGEFRVHLCEKSRGFGHVTPSSLTRRLASVGHHLEKRTGVRLGDFLEFEDEGKCLSRCRCRTEVIHDPSKHEQILGNPILFINYNVWFLQIISIRNRPCQLSVFHLESSHSTRHSLHEILIGSERHEQTFRTTTPHSVEDCGGTEIASRKEVDIPNHPSILKFRLFERNSHQS